ncbi:alpha/beta fold hydrolase [Arthrobacter sp. UM1]|uniref:alpha/beta fold hydrolase n=1 Tax=Arthrobacter sp. UM1 TaxID=2766776 RepID=UPI001CF60D9A|nr:alpha/beta fold hydrolase [Arthrobacter sp. UM1]MCB4208971.1 S9 family peptidase [Arthrobacter sp. UM1]
MSVDGAVGGGREASCGRAPADSAFEGFLADLRASAAQPRWSAPVRAGALWAHAFRPGGEDAPRLFLASRDELLAGRPGRAAPVPWGEESVLVSVAAKGTEHDDGPVLLAVVRDASGAERRHWRAAVRGGSLRWDAQPLTAEQARAAPDRRLLDRPRPTPVRQLAVKRRDGRPALWLCEEDSCRLLAEWPWGTRIADASLDEQGAWAALDSAEGPSRLAWIPFDAPCSSPSSHPSSDAHEHARFRLGSGSAGEPGPTWIRSRAVVPSGTEGTGAPIAPAAEASPGGEGPVPALVTVYGGFGVPHWPEAEPTVRPWLARGGIAVTAQVRGGGEYGRRFALAGRGPGKPRGVEDLLRVLEDLREREPNARPVLLGASHGGLLAALAALRRPDLVAGLALTAPLLDVRDLSEHPAGRWWEEEFAGSPREECSPLAVLEGTTTALPPLWLCLPAAEERLNREHPERFAELWARHGPAEVRREPATAHADALLRVLDERAARMLAFAWEAGAAGGRAQRTGGGRAEATRRRRPAGPGAGE